MVFTLPSIHQQTISLFFPLSNFSHPVFLTLLLSFPAVFTILPSLFLLLFFSLSLLSIYNLLHDFACSLSSSSQTSPLSVSLTITPSCPSFSLSMDNSSVFLRAAVCLPAYCDFHWDSFRDHSHLSRELEPRLRREINHSHLILACIHKRIHIQAIILLNFSLFHTHLLSCSVF